VGVSMGVHGHGLGGRATRGAGDQRAAASGNACLARAMHGNSASLATCQHVHLQTALRSTCPLPCPAPTVHRTPFFLPPTWIESALVSCEGPPTASADSKHSSSTTASARKSSFCLLAGTGGAGQRSELEGQ
jgi:hypothetical protein